MSKSGYHAWLKRGDSDRVKEDRELIVIMRNRFKVLRGNPGVRRMRAELASLASRGRP